MQNKYVDFSKKYIAGHLEYFWNPDKLAFQFKIITIQKVHKRNYDRIYGTESGINS